MKIILSPAKKMHVDTDNLAPVGLPGYLSITEEILAWLRGKSKEELKKLWGCNDKIAETNFERLEYMDLRRRLTPAILSYEGIAYQYMAPSLFENGQFDYVEEHLRILSAFYGVLKPMDGVTPYRLEMQAKAAIGDAKDLYEFWGSRLYEAVRDESGVMINLASKEYAKCIEKFVTTNDRYITVTFVEKSGDKLVTKGTYAKMARGEMVRFMAENHVEDPLEIRKFDRLGYVFREELSSETEYVFERVGYLKYISSWKSDDRFRCKIVGWRRLIGMESTERNMETGKKSRKLEIILIAAMLLVGVLMIVVMSFAKGGTKVVVSVGGQEYGVYSLHKNREIEIKSEEGINILKIENGQANMISATCPDKICVNMFPISEEVPGAIVCLPNKVIVELKEE